jgi:hypothetical protein
VCLRDYRNIRSTCLAVKWHCAAVSLVFLAIFARCCAESFTILPIAPDSPVRQVPQFGRGRWVTSVQNLLCQWRPSPRGGSIACIRGPRRSELNERLTIFLRRDDLQFFAPRLRSPPRGSTADQARSRPFLPTITGLNSFARPHARSRPRIVRRARGNLRPACVLPMGVPGRARGRYSEFRNRAFRRLRCDCLRELLPQHHPVAQRRFDRRAGALLIGAGHRHGRAKASRRQSEPVEARGATVLAPQKACRAQMSSSKITHAGLEES